MVAYSLDEGLNVTPSVLNRRRKVKKLESWCCASSLSFRGRFGFYLLAELALGRRYIERSTEGILSIDKRIELGLSPVNEMTPHEVKVNSAGANIKKMLNALVALLLLGFTPTR